MPEVLDLAFDTLAFLFERRVGVAFLSKGRIPKRHMELLAANAPQVRAQMGLTTLDDELASVFEPHAAPPERRLHQVRQPVGAGITTQVRLDPILPGLTDDVKTLGRVFASLADVGVRQVAASTLFLRPSIVRSLKRHLHGQRVLDALLSRFQPGERLAIHARGSMVLALPVEARRAIYGRVARMARAYGLALRLCACKNPDLATGPCSIAADWSRPPSRQVQLSLFSEGTPR